MIKGSIFKTCLLVFSLSAQLSFAELRLSQESISVFRRSQAAAVGMGSEFNARTTSLNCTLGLNYSKSRNRIEGTIVSSPRDESSSYDFETNYGFVFKASDCSKTTRKDKSGNSYLYTTCMKRKETCWSKFWNKDVPRFTVETLSFRSDFTINGGSYPLVDYNYVIQDENASTKSTHVEYKFNCFAPFYPTKALHDVLNF